MSYSRRWSTVTSSESYSSLFAYLASAGATPATEWLKRIVCERTGLSPEEVSVEVDPFGNINVTCKPKTPMKTVEIVLEPREGSEQ